MAIYQVVLSGNIYGQKWVNRFHYGSESVGSPPAVDANDVANSFLNQVVPFVRNIAATNSNWNVEDIVVTSLYDDTDFGEIVNLFLQGTVGAADSMPPFVATAFRTPRLRVGKNRGYKRFCGIGENHVTGNIVTGLGTQIADLANKLGDSLLVPHVDPIESMIPLVLFLEFDGVNPTTGRREYSFYDTETAQLAQSVEASEWTYYRLTSQRSRIAGHGI